MKLLQSYRCFTLFILIGLLGCSSEGRTLAIETPTPESYSTPEITPTITSTITASPTRTLTPTLVPTTTETPFHTPVLTEASEAVRQLLMQEMECESPCIWGVIPGQTTLEEAQDIFIRLKEPLQIGQMIGDVYSTIFDFNDGLGGTVILSVDNGYVSSINLGIGLANFKGDPYPRTWQAYSPETLFNKYGPPSEVYFSVSYPREPPFMTGKAWYSMDIYFESKNIIVEYGSGVTQEGELIRACPLSDQFSSGVGIWFGEDPVFPPPKGGVPLETATMLTLEEFYNLLKEGSKSACFDLIPEAFYPSP